MKLVELLHSAMAEAPPGGARPPRHRSQREDRGRRRDLETAPARSKKERERSHARRRLHAGALTPKGRPLVGSILQLAPSEEDCRAWRRAADVDNAENQLRWAWGDPPRLLHELGLRKAAARRAREAEHQRDYNRWSLDVTDSPGRLRHYRGHAHAQIQSACTPLLECLIRTVTSYL
jgi:hypothetical protein